MTSHEVNHVVLLEPRGSLWEGSESEDMERTLLEMAVRGRRVIVDLSDTDLLTAHGLGILAHAHRIAAETGGRLALCGAKRTQRWLLDRTHLLDVLEVFEDRHAALRAFNSGSQAVA